MESNLHSYKLPSQEEMQQLEEAMKGLKDYIIHLKWQQEQAQRESKEETELRPDVYSEIANKNRKTKVRQFQARPLNKQMVVTAQLLDVQNTLKEFRDQLEDTLIVLEFQMYERAKIIHEALREASKTDPSLLEAVREMDELYQQALEEEQEEEENLSD